MPAEASSSGSTTVASASRKSAGQGRDLAADAETIGGIKVVATSIEGADAAALRNAYDQVMSSCRAYDANADIRGVLVTPMAKKGTEVIVGVVRDPIFGPVLMFVAIAALGG